MSTTRPATTRELASFPTRLRHEDLPDEAVEPERNARNPAARGDGISVGEVDRIVARGRGLEEGTSVRDLLPEGPG